MEPAETATSSVLSDNLQPHLDRLGPAEHAHIQPGQSLVAVNLADECLVAHEGPVGHHDSVAFDDAHAHLDYLVERLHERGEPGDLVLAQGNDFLVAYAQQARERRDACQALHHVLDIVCLHEKVSGKERLPDANPATLNAAHDLAPRDKALFDAVTQQLVDEVADVLLLAANNLYNVKGHLRLPSGSRLAQAEAGNPGSAAKLHASPPGPPSRRKRRIHSP